MFEYFAGKFFTNSGIVKAEQADNIIQRLKLYEPHLDYIQEMNKDLLKENHIAFIQLLQNSINEKLGDLASEYDGFTDAQQKNMVRKQTALNTAFINHLIKLGYVDGESLSHELDKFRNYYGLNSPGISRNLKEDFDSILKRFINSSDYYVNEYATITLKYILRFIGTGIGFSESSNIFGYSEERIIVQKVITKSTRYFLGIASSKKNLQDFNDGIDTIFLPNKTNARYGSLFSFLNCITQIFHCLIDREKDVLFVDEPAVYKYSHITVNENCYLVSTSVDDMKLDIIVGYGTKPNFSTISHNI